MSEAVGSLAEEAAKLLGAAEVWWREHGPSIPAHQGPECKVCPLCQGISMFRTAQPEVFEHLVDAVGALLLALRSAVEAHESAWSQRGAGDRIERIDIT